MFTVTWIGTQAFCEYYGRRLTNELEREKAARGQEGRHYPKGDEIDRNNATPTYASLNAGFRGVR